MNNQRVSSFGELLFNRGLYCLVFVSTLVYQTQFLMAHRSYAILATPACYPGNVYTNLHKVDLNYRSALA